MSSSPESKSLIEDSKTVLRKRNVSRRSHPLRQWVQVLVQDDVYL